MTTTTVYSYLASPLGDLLLTADGAALTGLDMPRRGGALARPAGRRDDGALAFARRQLAEYFAGQRMVFDLPLRMEGTDFQRRVWEELLRIPFGATMSYGELAARIGRPSAARAVGAANGANPIGIVVPCHRVIGSTGALTGYGGGLENKRWLLDFEQQALGDKRPPAPGRTDRSAPLRRRASATAG